MMRQQQGQQEQAAVWNEIDSALRGDQRISEVLTAERVCPRDGWAHRIAKDLGSGMNPTQLRRFFGPLKAIADVHRWRNPDDEIQSENRVELLLLVPMLAYAVGRGRMPERFFWRLEACLGTTRLRTAADVVALGDFLTAVVAWHKFENPSGGG